MKRKGCSVIFFNDDHQVLLFLRDNIPTIPFPNMWDIPGGHVEPDETPERCIVREMREEMELELENFSLFSVMEFPDRIEYTFWKKSNLDIERITLHEGQCLRWFDQKEIEETELALGFNEILSSFFTEAPFL
ncbi:MAG: NUDIX hydrolase [Desulfobacterium sp.]|nr:NUDIX hydrolase [Desulfobacterium sp.]